MCLQLSHLEHHPIGLPPKLQQHLPQNEVQEEVTRMKRRVLLDRLKLAMVNKIEEIDSGVMAMHKQMGQTEMTRL